MVTSTGRKRSSVQETEQEKADAGAEGFPQKQKPFWGEYIRESGS